MEIRPAVMHDVDAIYRLLEHYAKEGLLLPRSHLSLYQSLQCFSVAVDEHDQVLGAAALHILGQGLAEVRSLAVDPGHRGQGVGRALVEYVVALARRLEIGRVIALTYQTGFFDKCGFRIISKAALPQKVWKDCLNCHKFPVCDEVAMEIRPYRGTAAPGLEPEGEAEGGAEPIQPVFRLP
ncbi:GCN5-related N-acetyltransferase [Candidatus Hydrogenisulfobacillus filiaventi]|uniref:GCN5-related N-acetyltransferase n=1 Tax=Candidatus Hydrogenisulfobacillus filiaventi TaxID=2707344 RepID=A0A6F8ZDR0_9FIRM|nr:N-acetyltransferase [Bacillota bacterium]CAB1127897.1 GCN5-related N-acetyltransferase [Candidatus Hydrogenisulfobacillus filiaventi]